MPGGEDVRKVSRQDIQLVQNLIERCLQLYMNQKEVVDTLSLQAKIEPSFTELGNTLVVLYAQKSLFFLIFTLHFTSFVHVVFVNTKLLVI